MTRRMALTALGALGAAACQAPGEVQQAESKAIVIAVVNEQPLTLDDAMSTFLSSHTGHGVLVQGEPAVRELAGRLVTRELFRAEAESLGIPEDEGVLAQVEDFRRETAETVFWRREVEERIQVSEEDVEDFYAKTEVALSISLMETQDRASAAELLQRVEQGEDFGELAQQHSTHPSRTFGGSIPYVRRGEIDSALEGVAFALQEPGELTPIVQTSSGFAFVRLEERTINLNRPPREVIIPQIRSILSGRHEDELREEVEERVQQRGRMKVDATHLTRDALLATSAADAVVAESAGETLNLGGLREMLNLDAVRNAPPDEVAVAAEGIVDDWAFDKALRLEIEESGLLRDPEVNALTESYRETAILTKLYESYVYADIDIAEEDLREYYETHKDTEYTQPAEVQLAYIVVETKEEALELLGRVEAGQDFADLAKAHSIDPTSAAHGGRIGWTRPGQLIETVEERALVLSPGEMDGPIETELGHFLVKALDRREAHLVPYQQARGSVMKRLVKEVKRESYDAWAVRLRERANVRIPDEGIDRAVAWLAAQAALAETDPSGEIVESSGHDSGASTNQGMQL